MRTLTVTLEIDVEDVSEEERREGLFLEEGEEPDELDLPAPVSELHPDDIADLLPYAILNTDNEMFAGSGVFANVVAARVQTASWTSGGSAPSGVAAQVPPPIREETSPFNQEPGKGEG